MAVLTVQNLCYGYSKGTPFEKAALHDVCCTFGEGEIVAVIGHTGSGKSTLLQHLNGLLKPDSGDVLLDGESIYSSKAALRECRFRVGMCFQYPEQQLFESTVRDDIAFGPKNQKLAADEIDRRVKESLAYVGLRDSYAEKSPFDLSGGEKRRVAIAGVLAMEPEVLILDEPSAGLDPAGKRSLLKLITDYHAQTNSTVIFVSHDMDDVAEIADRVLVLSKGRAVMSGTTREVFARADELLEMGLGLPEATSVMLRLRHEGLDVPTDVFTAEEAAAALLAFARKGAGA